LLLQTSLCLTAAAAVINFWISMRIGKIRVAEKVLYGDGGNEMLIRRMRAHANFIENAPLVLLLIALIEATGKGGVWLAPVGAVFMLGRVAHVIGMDGLVKARTAGTVITFLTQIVLAVVAVLIALGKL
jgi:hypothetical protein